MTRIASMFVAACTAVLISGSAFAQAPAAAPPAPPPPPAPYGEPISLEMARKAAAAAMAEAQKNNWGMCIAVVAPSGDLIYFEKMDNCQYASIAISQHKARASATFRRPTLAFENGLAAGPQNAYLVTLDGMIGSRGGNPIVVNGKLIGAIGVSGGTGDQDAAVCKAGADAIK